MRRGQLKGGTDKTCGIDETREWLRHGTKLMLYAGAVWLHSNNFCPALNVFLVLTPLYVSFFALSRRSCLIAPCLAFNHFCSPDSKLYDEIIHLITGFLPLDLSAAPTPSLFLPRLLCFLPPCFSRIPVPALPHTYLLVVLPAISFLAAFAIVSQLSSGSF